MLARPEPNTREHILLWLSSKDPEEKYLWESYTFCACAAYARETMGLRDIRWAGEMYPGSALGELNRMAMGLKTFGALYKRACERWSGEQA